MSSAILGASDASVGKADQVPCPTGAYRGAGGDRGLQVSLPSQPWPIQEGVAQRSRKNNIWPESCRLSLFTRMAPSHSQPPWKTVVRPGAAGGTVVS